MKTIKRQPWHRKEDKYQWQSNRATYAGTAFPNFKRGNVTNQSAIGINFDGPWIGHNQGQHNDKANAASVLLISDRPPSKRQKLLEARAARTAAKKAAAEAKAKELAYAKAKADRIDALHRLSPKARAAAEYFHANPGAFGCQKSHVVAIVEILTGEKIGGVL